MNFMKSYMLRMEKQELEYRLARLEALADSKVVYESENEYSNAIKKAWNKFMLNQIIPEYNMLIEQMPSIQDRIEDIKDELRTT